MTLPPAPVSGDPDIVATAPANLSSPVFPASGSPEAVQRGHDLGRLYESVRSAQNRAEIASWPELAQKLRGIRQAVWARICDDRR